MARINHGAYENILKSPYNLEYYDSSWELEYMKELENDQIVSKWTKNHGIRIKYFDLDNKFKTYNPDFLVEYADGTIELVEMKGQHLLNNPNTRRKMDYAKKWCNARKIKYRIYSKYQ
jgi:TnsA endonuclease N terminal